MENDNESRYAGRPLITYRHASGEEYQLRLLREIRITPTVFEATPVQGDRLDNLAARYYRDPLLFWKIADGSDHLDPIDILVPGEAVPIPPNR